MNCGHASVRHARRQASTSARELLEPTAQHTSVCCAECSTSFAVYVSTTTVSLSLVSLPAVSMSRTPASTRTKGPRHFFDKTEYERNGSSSAAVRIAHAQKKQRYTRRTGTKPGGVQNKGNQRYAVRFGPFLISYMRTLATKESVKCAAHAVEDASTLSRFC